MGWVTVYIEILGGQFAFKVNVFCTCHALHEAVFITPLEEKGGGSFGPIEFKIFLVSKQRKISWY